MTQSNIFKQEVEAFDEATKCFDIASTCRPIIRELLLAALQRASMKVVEESVKKPFPTGDDYQKQIWEFNKTLATAREITGIKE